jgi:hypothetical protein
MMVDGIDGRVHYVDIGRADRIPSVPEGGTVRIEPTKAEATAADRTVNAVARANGGRYSVDLHLRHDPHASEACSASHVRRLEAMRRAGAGPERQPDGSWAVPDDHLARAAAYAQQQKRDRPVAVSILSRTPVADLAIKEASTWLDRELASGTPSAVRAAGFGREVRDAMSARRQWLIEQQLADGTGQGFQLRRGALEALRLRELRDVGDRLGKELGKRFESINVGERVEVILGGVWTLRMGRMRSSSARGISHWCRGAMGLNATLERRRQGSCDPTGSVGSSAAGDPVRQSPRLRQHCDNTCAPSGGWTTSNSLCLRAKRRTVVNNYGLGEFLSAFPAGHERCEGQPPGKFLEEALEAHKNGGR